MKQLLTYFWRSCLSPWVIPTIIALTAANWLQRQRIYLGEGMWTADWAAISIPLIGVLVSGGAAIDASRVCLPRSCPPVDQTHTLRLWGPLLLVSTAPAVFVHILGVIVALVCGGVGNPVVGWLPIMGAVLVQCLALAWFGSLGLVVGRFFRPATAGVLAAGAGFVSFYALASYGPPQFSLLKLGGATIPMIGKTWSFPYLALQAIIFVATVAAAVFLPTKPGRSGRRLGVAGALVMVMVFLTPVVAARVAPWKLRTVADDIQPVPEMCQQRSVEICYYGEHAAHGELVVAEIDQLVESARERDYPALVPASVKERSRAQVDAEPGAMSFPVLSSYLSEGVIDRRELVDHLLVPFQCPALSSSTIPPPQYWWNMSSLAMTWISLSGGDTSQIPPNAEGPSPRVLTSEETRRVLEAFRQCDLSFAVG